MLPTTWRTSKERKYDRNRRIAHRTLNRNKQIELLEDRTLLTACTISWDGGGDGSSWEDEFNWSTNSVPSGSDDVCIDVPADVTIHVIGNHAVHSVHSQERFALTGGSLSIAADSEFYNTLDNDATVHLQSGTLILGGGGISAGTFTGTVGTGLVFRGTHMLGASSRITSAGGVDFGGTTIVGGVYDVAGRTSISLGQRFRRHRAGCPRACGPARARRSHRRRIDNDMAN